MPKHALDSGKRSKAKKATVWHLGVAAAATATTAKDEETKAPAPREDDDDETSSSSDVRSRDESSTSGDDESTSSSSDSLSSSSSSSSDDVGVLDIDERAVDDESNVSEYSDADDWPAVVVIAVDDVGAGTQQVYRVPANKELDSTTLGEFAMENGPSVQTIRVDKLEARHPYALLAAKVGINRSGDDTTGEWMRFASGLDSHVEARTVAVLHFLREAS
jgi:hypothetical protein